MVWWEKKRVYEKRKWWVGVWGKEVAFYLQLRLLGFERREWSR